jgi:hypothetical protein
VIVSEFVRAYAALGACGCSEPLLVALDSVIKVRYLPHRTYLVVDQDGFHYSPHIRQWTFRGKKLWRDEKEMARQRDCGKKRVER